MGDFSLKEYLDAWNAYDGSKVVALMADDVVFEDVPMGVRREGKDDVAAFVAETVQMSNDYRFDLVTEIYAGSDYAAEWVMSGTNTGEGGGLPATGKSFTIRGSSIGHLTPDGHITANRDYWNLADYLIQVGILPPLESPSA